MTSYASALALNGRQPAAGIPVSASDVVLSRNCLAHCRANLILSFDPDTHANHVNAFIANPYALPRPDLACRLQLTTWPSTAYQWLVHAGKLLCMCPKTISAKPTLWACLAPSAMLLKLGSSTCKTQSRYRRLQLHTFSNAAPNGCSCAGGPRQYMQLIERNRIAKPPPCYAELP